MGRKALVNGKGASPFLIFGDIMNKMKITLLVLSVILLAGIAEAQDQMPINPPPGYFGSVTINGQPASGGTTILAKIGGEVRGSITTSVSGFFGANPGPKLWVTGFQNETGSTVTFFYNNTTARQTAQLTGAATINRVDLDFVVPASAGIGGVSSGGGGGQEKV
jgi:hypothetical protein